MKKSEKRLLFALLSLALLGGLFVCSDIYFKKRDRLKDQHSQLEWTWMNYQILFEQKEMWEARGHWLDANQPEFIDKAAIARDLFERVDKPEISGVTTKQKNIIELVQAQNYTQTGVSFTAEGELASVFRWLYDLTPPSSFRLIRNITLTPNNEDPSLITARIDLLRWYSPPES